MKRLIAAMAVMIAISCCGMVAGGANNLPRGFDPVQIQTPIPKKFEDKFAMSQLVVRGTVTSISKADTGKAAAGVTESRTRMIAVVRVDEPLKGSIPLPLYPSPHFSTTPLPLPL